MINIIDELSQNFIDFSHEVNYQRAFADARDGLKPGQRACLWEMYKRGYKSNKPHVKSAKISGGVISNWWPHGDSAIYDTFARMSQKWINNIPEVDWHGANGSIQISGEAAASRYTEARLSKAAEEGLLYNIQKNNVLMKPNFSEDEEWPVVFPAILPRLMINGCQGIGSTIANVWLPHALTEVANLIHTYLKNGVIDYNNIAPSFPTGGIIINKNSLSDIYKTGKGKVILRGRAEIKDNYIIITEIPYQVYVEPLIEQIKKYALEKEDSGIENVLNKSNKNICIEIECSKNPKEILTALYKNTNLQKTYNANQYALAEGVPKLLTLKDYLNIYIDHNIECIIREINFDLAKATNRLEIVQGLLKALEDIDNIIALIKKSESAVAAKQKLIKKYDFTENQAKAILGMKLSSLARLEKIALNKEEEELTSKILKLEAILVSKDKQQDILLTRLDNLVVKYGDTRKTELIQINENKEDSVIQNIVPEDVVVILNQNGNIKRVPKKSFKVQKRKGKGIKSINDIVRTVISTNTQDNLLLFSQKGKMFKILVDDVPQGTNTSQGVLVESLIKISSDDKIIAMTSLAQNHSTKYVVFFTKKGLIKKTYLEEYLKIKRSTGIVAIKIKENDSIANVEFMNEENVLLITQEGMSIHFETKNINPIGRNSTGVKAINLTEEDEVLIGLPVKTNKDMFAIVSNKGYGKRTAISEFPLQGRGGKGVIIYKETPFYGHIIGVANLSNLDSLLLVGQPNSICVSANDLPVLTRNSYGNIIIKSNVSSIVKI